MTPAAQRSTSVCVEAVIPRLSHADVRLSMMYLPLINRRILMTLTQLRTLLAVADAGSVRGAADRLYVSQPAVSGAVASLERELGVELVRREGRGLRFT